MENPVVFEMRLTAYETQVAQVNRQGWKQTRADKGATAAAGRQEPQAPGKLTGLFALITRRPRATQPTTAQVG